jgi:hypothetical protein
VEFRVLTRVLVKKMLSMGEMGAILGLQLEISRLVTRHCSQAFTVWSVDGITLNTPVVKIIILNFFNYERYYFKFFLFFYSLEKETNRISFDASCKIRWNFLSFFIFFFFSFDYVKDKLIKKTFFSLNFLLFIIIFLKKWKKKKLCIFLTHCIANEKMKQKNWQ